MPKQKKICRVCGAEYEACQSVRTGSNIFNWREVACSPECGMKYLDRITASRSIVESAEETTAVRSSRKKKVEKTKSELESIIEVEYIPAEVEVSDSESIEITE